MATEPIPGAEMADGHTEALSVEDLVARMVALIEPARFRRWIAADGYPAFGFGNAAEIADAVLPAVLAYGDQREKAGAENALREAADAASPHGWTVVAQWLHERACAIRATPEEQS